MLAQGIGTNYVEEIGYTEPAHTDIRVFIANVVRYLLTFLGLVAIIFMVYGGFIWMTSNGDASKVDRAKKTLINAVIGLIIVISAYAIVTLVIDVFGDVTGLTCDPACDTAAGESCCNGSCCDGNCCGGTCCGAGLDYCCAGACSAVPCGNLSNENLFRLDSYSPVGTNVIRNARLRLSFSRTVNPAMVNDTYIRVTDGGGNAVTGFFEPAGSRIYFTPDGDCGVNDCGAVGCFASGDIHISIEGLADNSGNVLSRMDDPGSPFDIECGGIGDPCDFDFTVGSLIDCQNPLVSLDFGQVCAAANNELYARSSDDSGIDSLTFYIDDVELDTVVNPNADSPFNTRDEFLPVTWDGSAYAGDSVNIRVLARDIDDHTAQRNTSFRLRPEHCCDGVLNGDEVGIDCGGTCAACDGAACGLSLTDDCAVTAGLDCHANDNQCGSGFCDCTVPAGGCEVLGYASGVTNCCTCQAQPLIDWITPQGGFCRDADDNPLDTACLTDDNCGAGQTCDTETSNGAAGNLITIGGRNFGSVPGTVLIGGVNAALAGCANAWTATQVTVVVPAGTAAGMMAVELTEGASGHGYFAVYDGFLRNNIARPGLCDVTPTAAQQDDVLAYTGLNMTGAQAYFGNLRLNMAARSSAFAGAAGTAVVPNMDAGNTTTFIRNGLAVSNFLRFRKLLDEAAARAAITGFEPVRGAVGQYVTIYGSGFGNRRDGSSVYFDSNTGSGVSVEADYSFPEICGSSWSDGEITVKVPAGLNGLDDDYVLRIVLDNVTSDVIDSRGLNPEAFELDSALPLGPGLCRIEPKTAPNGTPVKLFGEYFNGPGSVWFQLDAEQTAGTWGTEEDYDFIETEVPPEAVSGPVYAESSAGVSGNSLNLTVGLCSEAADPDGACGAAGLCCPDTSYRAGRCASDDPDLGGNNDGNIDMSDCYMQIRSAVYEWTFSTEGLAGLGDPCYDPNSVTCTDTSLGLCSEGLFCDPNAGCTCQYETLLDESCNGLAKATGSCHTGFCPNAAGQCSPLAGSVENLGIACGDAVCANQFPNTAMNDDLNRCVSNDPCSLDTRINDIIGKPRQAYCAEYNGAGHWYMSTELSCPNGWRMLMGNICVDANGLNGTCDECAAGFACVDDKDDDDAGLCVIGTSVCPAGATCNGSTCERDNSQCECCCEVGQAERDCCAYTDPTSPTGYTQLTCEGSCGTGTGPEGQTWGHCTGCAAAADPDAACNCGGSTGRYCDTATNPAGVCLDCSQMSDAAACSDHSDYCCVDNDNNDFCRGGQGTLPGALNSLGYTMIASGGDPTYAYCSYYECDSANNNACSIAVGHTVASAVNPRSTLFTSTSTCVTHCGSGVGLEPEHSCFDEIAQSCTLTCDTGYDCIGESGCAGGACATDDHSCACCCSTVADNCSDINSALVCREDIGECVGGSRGMCCGCASDSECSVGSPTNVGCGLDDCCRTRPGIVQDSAYPADQASRVCRNTAIEIEFDQIMNPASLSSNAILVGDYLTETCPDGTTYLAAAGGGGDIGFWAKAWYSLGRRIARFLPGSIANAFTPPLADRNYCAVPGSINTVNTAVDTTLMTFAPARFLDPERLYYFIIKGDSDLDDDNSTGVLSMWGIGLNGTVTNSPSGGNNLFNGIFYNNAYVWSFETMGEQSDNNGVCVLSGIRVEPDNYLISTLADEQNEENDSNPNASNYDSVKDADKEFRVYAYSTGGQKISPVIGYSWHWQWTVADTNVLYIDTAPGLDPAGDRQLVQARDNLTDARTQLMARLVLDQDQNAYGGDGMEAAANIYVFLCNNPWPPRDPVNGSWNPWVDAETNCDPALQACHNTNFQIYYCRDTGKTGTFDDLPAIMSDDVVVRGQTVLSCSVTPGDCTGRGLGDSCGPDNRGVCSYFLKEAYFLRPPSPTGTTELNDGINTGVGEQAELSWTLLADPEVVGYRIYWGENSQNYEDYVDVREDSVIVDLGSLEEAVCTPNGGMMDCLINGLENDHRYFFNLTSYTADGVESEYYGEKYAVIEDSQAPSVPTGLAVASNSGEVQLSWDTAADAVNYRIYYGSNASNPGSHSDVGSDTEVIITGFTVGQTFYFSVSAWDDSGNESERSAPVAATIN